MDSEVRRRLDALAELVSIWSGDMADTAVSDLSDGVAALEGALCAALPLAGVEPVVFRYKSAGVCQKARWVYAEAGSPSIPAIAEPLYTAQPPVVSGLRALPDAKLSDWLRRINDAGDRLARHLGEGQPHSDMVSTVTGLSALALERLELLATPPAAAPVDLLIEAGRGMLADYEEANGEGVCDCRPEPENVGHTCNACLMRAALTESPSTGTGEAT